MDDKVKVVLDRNRLLLQNNIILTDELWEHLRASNVFTDSTLAEMKSSTSRERTVAKMAEVLGVRGSATFLKFCESLHWTGHQLLADALRQDFELQGQPDGVLRPEDISNLLNNYPKVARSISPKQMNDFINSISSKAREVSLREAWRKDKSRDKEKAMVATQRQMETAWRFQSELKEKDAQVRAMRQSLETAVRESEAKSREAKELASYMEYMKAQHIKEMDSQMKFSMVNDKSLQKLTEREDELENAIKLVARNLEDSLERIDRSSSTSNKSYGKQSEELDLHQMLYRSLNSVDKLKAVMERVVQTLNRFQTLQTDHQRLLDDRIYMLSQLGVNYSLDLRVAFCEFVVSKEEQISKMKDLVAGLRSKLSTTDSNDQLGRLTKELSLKDNRIHLLEQQLAQAQTSGMKGGPGPEGNFSTSEKFLPRRRPGSPVISNYVATGVTSDLSSPMETDSKSTPRLPYMKRSFSSLVGKVGKDHPKNFTSTNHAESNHTPDVTLPPVSRSPIANPYQNHVRSQKRGPPPIAAAAATATANPSKPAQTILRRPHNLVNTQPKTSNHPSDLMRQSTMVMMRGPKDELDPLRVAGLHSRK